MELVTDKFGILLKMFRTHKDLCRVVVTYYTLPPTRLIYFLESLLASTHEGKAQVEAYSHEAQILLQGWILPEAISDEITCLCAQVQKHQLTAFLEKVEKAVKYSQYIREGRSDIANPWEGETEINSSNGTVKKV